MGTGRLVSSSVRGGITILHYLVSPGEYVMVLCDLESRRCSCARGEQTACGHLADADGETMIAADVAAQAA